MSHKYVITELPENPESAYRFSLVRQSDGEAIGYYASLDLALESLQFNNEREKRHSMEPTERLITRILVDGIGLWRDQLITDQELVLQVSIMVQDWIDMQSGGDI